MFQNYTAVLVILSIKKITNHQYSQLPSITEKVLQYLGLYSIYENYWNIKQLLNSNSFYHHDSPPPYLSIPAPSPMHLLNH